MKWTEANGIRYAKAQIARTNVIDIDNLRIDQRVYTEETSRRWFFLFETENEQIIQQVSMAYTSGWDSWNEYEEALRKYLNGEVDILHQVAVSKEFDFAQWNGDWSLINGAL